MSRVRTLGVTAAARLVGCSPQLLRWRSKTGKIRTARREPLRFRLVDLILARDKMRRRDPRGQKSGAAAESRSVAEIAGCKKTIEEILR